MSNLTGGFIEVGGDLFPYPDYESGLQTQSTMVDGGFNTQGEFLGQVIGNTRSKVELSWEIMAAPQWAALLQKFDKEYGGKFVNTVKYYDMAAGAVLTRYMYVGDRSARPHKVDTATGEWEIARQCKLNLVDTGRRG